MEGLAAGMPCRLDRRSLCLLHVELFKELSLSSGCRINTGRILWISSCRMNGMKLLEVSVKTVMPLLCMDHF